ncbi:MAG: SDR family oxidoreductase [Clostridia bacterium]
MFAFVSGASGDIGKEITIHLVNLGYTVICHYNKNEKVIDELSKKFGDKIIPTKCNFSNTKEVDFWSKNLSSVYPDIEIIINNAGFAFQDLIHKMPYQKTVDLINTNLTSTIITTKNLVGKMISNRYGKIINISSIWGTYGGSCEVVYSASKGGLIAFTKALAKELGLSNINVNCLSLGFIDTKMNKDIDKDSTNSFVGDLSIPRLGTPLDVANAVDFLVSDKSSYITGQIIGVDGGF